MASPKPLLTVRALRETGHRKATVKLGPGQPTGKAADSMDWEVLDPTGQTVGFVAGEATAKTVSRLAELHRLLVEIGGYHHLKARFDNGYLEVPVEMLKSLEKLLAP
jgi:hypothetical protein